MNPETGGATDATAANPINDETSPSLEPSTTPSLLDGILQELGVASDVRGELVKSKDQTHEQTQQEPAGDPDGSKPAGATLEKHESKTAGTNGADSPQVDPEDRPRDDWPDTAKQRVAQLTTRKNTLKTERDSAQEKANTLARERDELEARLKKAAPVQLAPSERDPLAHIADEQELGRLEADYQAILDWTTLNPDGAVDVPNGKDKAGEPVLADYTAEQVRQHRVDAERKLRAVPARRDYIRARETRDAKARELYPEIFNTEADEYQIAQQLLRDMPELLRWPDVNLNVGRYIRGLQAEVKPPAAERSDVKSKTAPFRRPQPPLAPSIPAVREIKLPAQVADRELQDARTRAAESGGTDEAIENLIASIQRQSNGNSPRSPALV